MSDTTYTLEWRGAKKSGLSYADIEAGLSAGDIHSLYKINVDGRWIVLRDFLEQHRAAEQAEKRSAAAAAAAAAQQAAYAPPAHYPQQTAPYQPQYQQHYPPQTAPSHYPPQQAYAASPPPPLQKGKQEQMMPSSPHAKAPAHKPAWLWPVIISSVTVMILVGIVTVYFIASSHFNKKTPPNTDLTNVSETKKGGEEAKKGAADGKPGQMQIHPYSRAGKEFFPSALVSTSNVQWNNRELHGFGLPIYGDEGGWMGMALEGVKKDAQVSVAITVDGFTKSSKWEGPVTAVNEDGAVMIMPKMIWDYAALLKIRQQLPVNVSFTATVDGKPLPEVTETFTMRSINDCPLVLANADDKGETDLSFLFAAYVNENHPQVQKILKEALDTGLVDSFSGYACNDCEGKDEHKKRVLHVRKQVFAIWNALQRRGIKYSSVTNTPPGDRVFCQSVRFLDESIDNRSANCVDGTVLMASVLQKIGIQAYLVLVPGHCFLAFNEIENSAAMPTGLETTMLGFDNITNVNKLEFLTEAQQSKENQASVNTFVEALNVGSSRIQGCVLNLRGGNNTEYQLISIKSARKAGIAPIASEH